MQRPLIMKFLPIYDNEADSTSRNSMANHFGDISPFRGHNVNAPNRIDHVARKNSITLHGIVCWNSELRELLHFSFRSLGLLVGEMLIRKSPVRLSLRGLKKKRREALFGANRFFSIVQRKEDDVNADLYKDQNKTWADKKLPAAILPYAKLARVDRPIGTWLLLFPGLWSIVLAGKAGSIPDVKLMGLFTVGAFAMRGAGCTINDFWDRDIDGKVKRTMLRPLASGQVSSTQALIFMAAQSALGFFVLVQMNLFTIGLGAASLIPVVLYPLAKRYTGWPQAVLGLTINWGTLLGWAAVHGSLDISVVGPLYLGGASWTLLYDTIYAYQDKVDDQKLGLKSSALTIGDRMAKPVLSVFGVASIALWALAGHNAGIGESPFFVAGLGATSAHLGWQIATADLNDRLNLTRRFVSNRDVGILMLAGIFGAKFS